MQKRRRKQLNSLINFISKIKKKSLRKVSILNSNSKKAFVNSKTATGQENYGSNNKWDSYTISDSVYYFDSDSRIINAASFFQRDKKRCQ